MAVEWRKRGIWLLVVANARPVSSVRVLPKKFHPKPLKTSPAGSKRQDPFRLLGADDSLTIHRAEILQYRLSPQDIMVAPW